MPQSTAVRDRRRSARASRRATQSSPIPTPSNPARHFADQTVNSVNPKIAASSYAHPTAGGRRAATTRFVRAPAPASGRRTRSRSRSPTIRISSPNATAASKLGVEQQFAGGAYNLDATAFLQPLRRSHRHRRTVDCATPAATGPTTSRTRAHAGSSCPDAARLPGGLRSAPATRCWRRRFSSVDGLGELAPAPFAVGDPLIRRPRHQSSLDVWYSAVRLRPSPSWFNGRGTLDLGAELRKFRRSLLLRRAYVLDQCRRQRAARRTASRCSARLNTDGSPVRRDARLPCARPKRHRGSARCCGPITFRSLTVRRGAAGVSTAGVDSRRPSEAILDAASSSAAGPNGSGKTTLLEILGGTASRRSPAASSSTAAAGGVVAAAARAPDCGRPAGNARRRSTSRCSTSCSWAATRISARSRSRAPPTSRSRGKRSRPPARRIRGPRRSATLSGGEKQRVVIASALAQASDLLLLDEPTASLDLGYQLEIASLLRRLNRDRGTTMVVSTHDLNFAAALCGRSCS